MTLRSFARVLPVGVLAGLTTLSWPAASGAQVAAFCAAATVTFVQTVGSPSAPVLVPMNLPVNVCTLSRNVQVIVPAFQVVGTGGATVIVPQVLSPVLCTPRPVALTPVLSGAGRVLQVVQIGGSPGAATSTTVGATVMTPVFACF